MVSMFRFSLLVATIVVGNITGPVMGQSITSRKDSLGQTHFDGRDSSGNRFSGLSRTDSIGQTHTSIRQGNRQLECIGRTDSIGITKQDCH